MDCTCVELMGSGRVATAASIASFMMATVSGGNDAFGKSFIRSVLLQSLIIELTRPETPSSLLYQLPEQQIVPWRWCGVLLPNRSSIDANPREPAIHHATAFSASAPFSLFER
jgi:hypothetical protein